LDKEFDIIGKCCTDFETEVPTKFRLENFEERDAFRDLGVDNMRISDSKQGLYSVERELFEL
jgi:hypothetical protein